MSEREGDKNFLLEPPPPWYPMNVAKARFTLGFAQHEALTKERILEQHQLFEEHGQPAVEDMVEMDQARNVLIEELPNPLFMNGSGWNHSTIGRAKALLGIAPNQKVTADGFRWRCFYLKDEKTNLSKDMKGLLLSAWAVLNKYFEERREDKITQEQLETRLASPPPSYLADAAPLPYELTDEIPEEETQRFLKERQAIEEAQRKVEKEAALAHIKKLESKLPVLLDQSDNWKTPWYDMSVAKAKYVLGFGAAEEITRDDPYLRSTFLNENGEPSHVLHFLLLRAYQLFDLDLWHPVHHDVTENYAKRNFSYFGDTVIEQTDLHRRKKEELNNNLYVPHLMGYWALPYLHLREIAQGPIPAITTVSDARELLGFRNYAMLSDEQIDERVRYLRQGEFSERTKSQLLMAGQIAKSEPYAPCPETITEAEACFHLFVLSFDPEETTRPQLYATYRRTLTNPYPMDPKPDHHALALYYITLRELVEENKETAVPELSTPKEIMGYLNDHEIAEEELNALYEYLQRGHLTDKTKREITQAYHVLQGIQPLSLDMTEEEARVFLKYGETEALKKENLKLRYWKYKKDPLYADLQDELKTAYEILLKIAA